MIGILYAVLIIGGVGILLGVILSLASKFMNVPGDEREEKIRACLPGANCGACGYSGCDGYAAAIAKGEVEPNLCIPGGSSTSEQLSLIIGKKVETERKTAFVKCNHGLDKTTKEFAYTGAASCAAENLMYKGPLSCKCGCLGQGDCVRVCDYGAITIVNGCAKVDQEKCVCCAKCVAACPKGIIEILPERQNYYVACSSLDKGAIARKKCTAACIACKKCETVCSVGAIKVENNLAVIDPDKCVDCRKCVAACPVKCIILKGKE